MSAGVAHVVVDGSNIATEGRSTPSLAQLEGAVTELRREMPDAQVIVVVDATFAHRIDADERGSFERAALRGEYVYPPAGAIGRGDAFLLRIAQKIDATVLSNDSFQEFHGEHDWLFERGRLIGATPVPGVGWIFVPRTPVRGAKSRIAVRDADRSKSKVEKAIAVATREAVEPDAAQKGQRKGKKKAAAEAAPADGKDGRQPRAVNDPLTFISFVAEHPLGATLEGEVESFTSHGAVVRVGEMHCYVPLSGLGNPPPRSAREVLRREERRSFVLTALDPQRRGVELALPAVAVVSGRPSEETVEAEVAMTKAGRGGGAGAAAAAAEPPAPGKRGRRKGEAAGAVAVEVPEAAAASAEKPSPAKRGRRKGEAAEAAQDKAPDVVPDVAAAKAGRRRKGASTSAEPEPPPAPSAPPAPPAPRGRKAAAAPEAEPAPEPPPAGRARKAATAAAPEPGPAQTERSRKRAAASAPAPSRTRPARRASTPATPATEPPAPAPARASRSRKSASPEPAEAPAPTRAPRTRKAAASPAPEPPAPARASRIRKAATEPPPPAPAPSTRTRKSAAPPAASTGTRKSAAPPPARPAPARSSRSRKAAAAEPPPSPPARPRRGR